MGSKKNFFISYTKADEQWAQWIAGQLENKEYTTIIQAWDFNPGTNFVSNMHNALIDCERFMAVISPDYFKSLYCQSEWTAAFTKDPSSEKVLFIPVRVKECKPEGLFAPVIYIDLCGVDEPEAVERLLNGISTDRPRNRPGFPGTSSKPKFPGQLPFNNLPFRKNSNFTGREDILEGIQKSFKQEQYTSLTQSVSGLGGVGKTQIVLEYAFEYGHLYDTIWWVNAESPLTLIESYSSFVYNNELLDKEINEKDIIIETVCNWMSQHKNWLFIYDNAEDHKSIYDYLPKINTGHILITSRYTDWYRLGAVISIDVFKLKEAEDFLIKRTGIDDRKSAALLAEKLGYLPLALEQTAAYIVKNKTTYEKYVELFNKFGLEIFKKDKYESNDYNSTVTVTWNISIRKINNKSSNQLLNICSFLAPDNIDRDIITESNKYLPEPLASETLSELDYNNIISELSQYSLITLQDNKISMHRLLQEVIRESINKKEWIGYCLNSIYELFDFDYNNQNTWGKCSELIPHALSVAKHSDEMSVDLKKVAWLYNEAAKWLNHTATYEEAEPLYRRALAIREEVLGANHPDTATSLNNLAALYDNQGKYDEAEPLLKRALAITEEVLGVNHPDTASYLNNLAELYRSQGKYEEAEPLYRRVLAIREELLGANHPDTATSLNNLALLYDNQGKYDEAEPLYQRAFEIIEDVLGVNHPSTANALNNLALLYKSQGRYDKAQPFYQRAFAITEEVLGVNHPDTASYLNNLAGLYHSQGKYDEAEPLYNRALAIREEVLGANHPSTATSLNNLAGLYHNQGKYDEAEPLYNRSLAIREKVLGANHPDTATSLNNLAFLYANQGKYKKAELLYNRTLEIRKELLGANHPDTATSLNNLALLYDNQGKYDEAEPLYQRALAIREEVVGANHPDTATSLNNLAGLYHNQGKYDEAEPLYRRALAILEEVLGTNHPSTATALNNLAGLYHNQGKYDEAEPLYRRALAILEEVLGTNHPSTATALNNLAGLYRKQKRVPPTV